MKSQWIALIIARVCIEFSIVINCNSMSFMMDPCHHANCYNFATIWSLLGRHNVLHVVGLTTRISSDLRKLQYGSGNERRGTRRWHPMACPSTAHACAWRVHRQLAHYVCIAQLQLACCVRVDRLCIACEWPAQEQLIVWIKALLIVWINDLLIVWPKALLIA